MNTRATLPALVFLLASLVFNARAIAGPHDAHEGHDMSEVEVPEKPATDAHQDHKRTEPSTLETPKSGKQDSGMEAMDMSGMQGGKAPKNARDPHAYSNGLQMQHEKGTGMGDKLFGSVLLDKFEYFNGQNSKGLKFDGEAWFGGDQNKLWPKAEGEREDNETGTTRLEALWNRTFTTHWSTQIGIRHDAWEGPSRTWVAFGIEGLAPYWFDVEATAYIGENGRTALRGELDYEFLLTQRLILQPNIEINVYGKNDEDKGIGSGLSEIEAGLRLRYEIKREFAPYVGISWHRKYGKTADYARAEGAETDDAQLVIGLRLWY